MLQQYEKSIINLLSKNDSFFTSTEISLQIGCSIRSVKNYIKNINAIYNNCIVSSNKGYKLKYMPIINNQSFSQEIPQTFENRKKVLFKLLLIDCKTIDLYVLSETFCVAPETLLKEIRLFNQELTYNNLRIEVKKSIISLKGTEKDKRSAISNYINKDIKNSIFSYSALEEYYPDYHIKALHQITDRILQEESYYMDDFSIYNIIMHLVIAVDRTKYLNSSQDLITQENENVVPKHIKYIAKKIIDEINRELHINFAIEDIYDFEILLSTRIIKKDMLESTLDKAISNFDSDVISLIKEIDIKLRETYNINFTNPQSKLRFYIHIKNLITRLKNNINISNPMINEARKHIYIYDVAIMIAKIIENKYSCTVTNDEIAYIAIHLLFSFGEEFENKTRLTMLIVCPDYSILKHRILDKIKSTFSEDIISIETSPYFLSSVDNNYDVVVSLIDGGLSISYSYVLISNHFDSKDIYKISKEIERVKRNKKINEFKGIIDFFFKPDFYFYSEKELTMNEVLEIQADKIKDYGYVNENYKKELFEREEKYPSTYGSFSIAHPLNQNAYKSIVSVYISKKGINWCNKQKIKIAFTLAINEKDQNSFAELIDFLSNILFDEATFNKVVKAKDYNEFVYTLLDIYKNKQ